MVAEIKKVVQMSEKINKRNDPNYKQVIGYVHIDTASEFRSLCVKKGLNVSEAMETALKTWIDLSKESEKT